MKRLVKTRQTLFLLSISVFAWTSLLAGPLTQPASTQQADNSKANKTETQKKALTADKQSMNAGDQQITQKIRSAIMKDKTLSTYAHNIKIITQDRKVTLKGPVRSEDERADVEAKAIAVAGEGNVTNEIKIALPKQ